MDNWLNNTPDMDIADIGKVNPDYQCPLCKGRKRGIEDVCSKCSKTDEYKESLKTGKTISIMTDPPKRLTRRTTSQQQLANDLNDI